MAECGHSEEGAWPCRAWGLPGTGDGEPAPDPGRAPHPAPQSGLSGRVQALPRGPSPPASVGRCKGRAQPVPSPALLPGVLPAEGLSFLLSLSFCATALCLPVPVSPSLPLPPCPFPPQIPRYILTLHELLAHTPHEHVERNSLDYAKSKLEELSR